jgi:Arc/MetJ-type ribon-helix-helix transcriptional regulator
MAETYTENLQIKLPRGAKEELVAARRYQSATSVARQAIMAVIEKAEIKDEKAAQSCLKKETPRRLESAAGHCKPNAPNQLANPPVAVKNWLTSPIN